MQNNGIVSNSIQETDGRMDGRTDCPSVGPSVCLLDGVWHI